MLLLELRKERGEGKRGLGGERERGRVYDLWKKEQVTQQYYEDVVRLYGKEIRSAKAHLELNLASKRQLKCLYKFIYKKRRNKETPSLTRCRGKRSDKK